MRGGQGDGTATGAVTLERPRYTRGQQPGASHGHGSRPQLSELMVIDATGTAQRGSLEPSNLRVRLLRQHLMQLRLTCAAMEARIYDMMREREAMQSEVNVSDAMSPAMPSRRGTSSPIDAPDQTRLIPVNILSGRRILVVDDSANNRLLARSVLESWGCTVDAVANGQEAVEAATTSDYDVVLMDCLMPEMDGFAATSAIRAWESGCTDGCPRLPILGLTSGVTEDHRRHCLDAGMDDIVAKPYLPTTLARMLVRWTATSRTHVRQS